jgi:hypothetical protein
MATFIVTTERIRGRAKDGLRILEGRTTHRLEANSLDDAWEKARAHFYAPDSDSSIQIIAVEQITSGA